MVDEPNDVVLLERIALRQPDALRVLYDRYGRVAYALAYRVVGEAVTAETVVVEAFEIVWNEGQAFSIARGANVRGWLFSIVRHQSIAARRRADDRPPRNLPLDARSRVLASPDVWAAVPTHRLGEHVRIAMDTLPPSERRAVELAFFDGLSHGEIASQEGVSIDAVSESLHLGLRSVSRALRTSLDGTGPFLEKQA